MRNLHEAGLPGTLYNLEGRKIKTKNPTPDKTKPQKTLGQSLMLGPLRNIFFIAFLLSGMVLQSILRG